MEIYLPSSQVTSDYPCHLNYDVLFHRYLDEDGDGVYERAENSHIWYVQYVSD